MVFKQKMGSVRWIALSLLLGAVLIFFFAPFVLLAAIPLGAVGLLLLATSFPNSIGIDGNALKQNAGFPGEIALVATEIQSCKFHWLLPLGGGRSFRLACFEIKGSGTFPKRVYIESWGWNNEHSRLFAALQSLLSHSHITMDERTKDRLQRLTS
jgi:hypothetical protein